MPSVSQLQRRCYTLRNFSFAGVTQTITTGWPSGKAAAVEKVAEGTLRTCF